jgi:hypothetical protein
VPTCEAHQLLPERSVTGYSKTWPIEAASRLNEYRPVLLLGEPPYPHDKRSLAEAEGLPQVRLALMVGRKQGGAVGDYINPVARKAGRLQRASDSWCTSNDSARGEAEHPARRTVVTWGDPVKRRHQGGLAASGE